MVLAVAAVLVLAQSDAKPTEPNPVYDCWAKCRPGTTVVIRVEEKRDGKTVVAHEDHVTLMRVDTDALFLERRRVELGDGERREGAAVEEREPAKLFACSGHEWKEESGVGNREVDGRVVKCSWLRRSYYTVDRVTEQWVSDDVPCRVVLDVRTEGATTWTQRLVQMAFAR